MEAEESTAIDSSYCPVNSDFVDRVILIQTFITSDRNPTQPSLQAGLTSQLPDQRKDYRDREKSKLFSRDAIAANTSST